MIDWSWKIKTETILALVIAALLALCVLSITVPLLVFEPHSKIDSVDWKARYHEATQIEEQALREVEIWQKCCIECYDIRAETLRQLGLDKPARPGM